MPLRPEWTLVDSMARAGAHPETWVHPPDSILDLVFPGCRVHVAVYTNTEDGQKVGERFWCLVIAQKIKEGDEVFLIEVEQELVLDHGLDRFSRFLVKRRHIFGVINRQLEFVWGTDKRA